MSAKNVVVATGLLALLCLFVTPVFAETNIIANGDLETAEPFFFHPVGEGAILTWATDEAYGDVRSLKIEKSSTTSEAVGWISENQANRYWNNMQGGNLYHLGALIKSSEVNTDPPDDTYKIGLQWGFYEGGSLIAEEFTPIDQTVASKDWDTVHAYVAMPSTPDSAYCFFKFGENATGTAWADNFILGSDPWTAGFFGGSCETPAGWMEWHSVGDTGLAEYSDEYAHSGTYSAKLMDLDARADEIVFYSIPYPCDPNTMYHFSVWTKKLDINTDPHYLPANWCQIRDDDRIGITVGFLSAPLETQWNWLGDNFFYINQVDSVGDWEKYEVVATSPSDAAGVSIRARFTSFPTGTVYYDDFEIREVTVVPIGIEEDGHEIASSRLLQNYPNPFAQETYIRYQLPKNTHANLTIYDIIGRKVVTLVNDHQQVGYYSVRWDGRTENGERVANGIYFYRLTTDDFQSTEKMLIMR